MNIQTNNYINQTMFNSKPITKTRNSNISFSALENGNNNKNYDEIKLQHQKNRKKAKAQRTLALATAMGLTATGVIGGIVGVFSPQKGKDDGLDLSNPPAIEQPVEQDIIDNEPDIDIDQIRKQIAEGIMDAKPEVREQYDKITSALDTFSRHLGEDGLTVIQKAVNEVGDGKVDTIDVLKVLFMESSGKIYDNDGSILKSDAGAYGPFQITEDTQNYLNHYYGVNLDIKDPYDNVEACVYNMRFLAEKRSNDIAQGKELPVGTDLDLAVIWSYHDGAWATSISRQGQNHINKYETLSILDDYPQVIDYILN